MPVSISGSGPITGLTSIASPTTLNGLTIPTLGFGKVLQIVSNTYSTGVAVASTSYTDSGLSASITPSSSSSKILVIASQPMRVYSQANGERRGGLQIVRGTTAILSNGSAAGGSFAPNTTSYWTSISTASAVVLDSPATTSAITYKAQIKIDSTANDSGVIAQENGSTSSIVLVEIGP